MKAKQTKEPEERGNHIQIGIEGVLVSSYKSNLREVEACANRLIKKHKDFIQIKLINNAKLSSGVN